MANSISQFEQRKQDHIRLAMMDDNQATELNQFDQVQLTHQALPEINFNDISITGQRFGRAVATPFLVSSMTAGHQHGEQINFNLAAACAQTGWAMGVGSQRRQLTDESAAREWQAIREHFPEVVLFANLGIAQIIEHPAEAILPLIESLQAQALIIHCNPLQECIQPEGTPNFANGIAKIVSLCHRLAVPVIIKETGCGFSEKTLQQLMNKGIAAVDVSGSGGTHWGRIEGHRSSHLPSNQQAALTFRNWGISTVQSLYHAKRLSPDFEIWASGGIRHGLDAAKAIALGGKTVGLAKPMLEVALQSVEAVVERMTQFEFELKVAMFCTGSKTLDELQGALN
ncbi:type 2 isopentenyl-diphosphate Delta-isomerase [Legionella sp. W05-934-2]|jgi:isopentenyl-diphosphate delta-isomerase|uniref:type 2 isopentenyl-diphosphate Delta-isomerase n=1 Tax=Legionella sp. W05-934-2 TaxID=1198649 RepID=UPI0034636283